MHCPTDDVTVWVVGDCIITLVTIDEKEGLKTLIWTWIRSCVTKINPTREEVNAKLIHQVKILRPKTDLINKRLQNDLFLVRFMKKIKFWKTFWQFWSILTLGPSYLLIWAWLNALIWLEESIFSSIIDGKSGKWPKVILQIKHIIFLMKFSQYVCN